MGNYEDLPTWKPVGTPTDFHMGKISYFPMGLIFMKENQWIIPVRAEPEGAYVAADEVYTAKLHLGAVYVARVSS